MDTNQSTTSPESGSDDVTARIMDAITIEGEEEIAAAPAEETSETEETSEEETLEASEEETSEEETSETEETSEETEETSEETTDDDGVELSSSDFAQLLGIEESSLLVDDDGAVSIQTKVDGEIGKVELNDLIKSYQTEAYVTKKSQALAEDRRAFDTEVTQQAEVLKGRINEVVGLSQVLEQQLTSEYNSIDWGHLRATNPGEYAAKQTELQNRANEVAQAKQQAGLVLQQQIQENANKMGVERETYMTTEAEALRTAIPEWNDPDVAKTQFTDLSNFLTDTYGFSENDVGGVENHKLILLARDAMQFRRSEKVAKVAAKKLKVLPKLTKPGAGRRNAGKNADAQAQQNNRVRLKKTGSAKDLASVLAGRISI